MKKFIVLSGIQREKFIRTMFFLFALLTTSSCQNKTDMVREEVLSHYRSTDADELKYQAAEFLLDNMHHHYSTEEIDSVPFALEDYRRRVDSSYYALVRDVHPGSLPWEEINRLKSYWREYVKNNPLPEAGVRREIRPDKELITSDFLIRHIDHAFKMWRTSKYAQELSFEEFKEYLLPYRSVSYYGFLESGDALYGYFGKYVPTDTSMSLRECIRAYNLHIGNLRDMGGKTTRRRTAGIYDFYTRDFHGCTDIAGYGCNILRACGIPVVVEYNVCYRSLEGRHYHVAVFDGKGWQRFNPESSLPGDGDWASAETANVYRTTFSTQEDTPFFKRGKGEFVPDILQGTCMKDVTADLLPETSITLPFNEESDVRLAYLATYNRNRNGFLPVTWGEIANKEVTFRHAIPGLLYFPIYYPASHSPQSFSTPFYVTLEGEKTVIRRLPHVDLSNETGDLQLTRKYPRKPNMVRVAEELVRGRFEGANKKDFSDAVTLCTITQAPQPKLQDIAFEQTGKYRYYRFVAPKEHPHANISMLEWLTPRSMGYANADTPTRPHILDAADTLLLQGEEMARLLDDVSWEKMAWKSEYDGKMHTAPGAYPTISLRLKEPQVVTLVRYAPLNADNGIHSGDCYELFYWDGGWISLGIQTPTYEYVEFKDVPKNKLYWLKNLSTGKEEQPFVMKDGKQLFVYSDVIK